MPKYRRKPVEVEAQQFIFYRKPWPEGVQEIGKGWKVPHDAPPRYNFMGAAVCAIHPGDWVVTNQTGERYVVSEESFPKTYEEVKP